MEKHQISMLHFNFVEAILERYASNAQNILDPFAGTGTTAFTASQLNKTAYFCEINPVLQFLTLAKIKVRRLNSSQRTALVQALGEAKESIMEFDKFPRDHVKCHRFFRPEFSDS